jgi:hypothetical protein
MTGRSHSPAVVASGRVPPPLRRGGLPLACPCVPLGSRFAAVRPVGHSNPPARPIRRGLCPHPKRPPRSKSLSDGGTSQAASLSANPAPHGAVHPRPGPANWGTRVTGGSLPDFRVSLLHGPKGVWRAGQAFGGRHWNTGCLCRGGNARGTDPCERKEGSCGEASEVVVAEATYRSCVALLRDPCGGTDSYNPDFGVPRSDSRSFRSRGGLSASSSFCQNVGVGHPYAWGRSATPRSGVLGHLGWI